MILFLRADLIVFLIFLGRPMLWGPPWVQLTFIPVSWKGSYEGSILIWGILCQPVQSISRRLAPNIFADMRVYDQISFKTIYTMTYIRFRNNHRFAMFKIHCEMYIDHFTELWWSIPYALSKHLYINFWMIIFSQYQLRLIHNSVQSLVAWQCNFSIVTRWTNGI